MRLRTSPPLTWLVCAAGLGLVPPLLLHHAMRVFGLASDAAASVHVVAGLVAGALLVDLVTGLVHWACDTWGDEDVPVLGPGLIHSFREHHVDPRAMLAHDAVFVNRETALTGLFGLSIAALPGVADLLEAHAFLYAALVSSMGYGAFANQLHYWAHQPTPPMPVRALQRIRLVLSPEAHARHHAAPNTRAYCISTGWLNPLLDAVGFWRGLERVVSGLTGAVPRRGGIDRSDR